MASISDDHRRLRQSVRLLCSAVYARAGAQPCKRFRAEGSARACRAGIFGSATAWADGEFLLRSFFAPHAFFGITAGGSGCAGDAAGTFHYLASARFWRGYCGGARDGAETLQSRAPAGAIRIHASAAGDGANVYA